MLALQIVHGSRILDQQATAAQSQRISPSQPADRQMGARVLVPRCLPVPQAVRNNSFSEEQAWLERAVVRSHSAHCAGPQQRHSSAAVCPPWARRTGNRGCRATQRPRSNRRAF